MKKLLVCGLAAVCLMAQSNAPEVALSDGPPAKGWTNLYKYTAISGADYIEYICSAPSQRPAELISVTQAVDSGSTSTVTTAVNHGLAAGNLVTFAGFTGGAAGLNTSFKVVSVGSATTFTITTSGISDATYNNAGITLSTSAPRSSQPIWAIKRFTYGGTGGTSVIAEQWAVKTGSDSAFPSSPGAQNACDDRTTLAYQ
jgi:hypothetical protein